MKTRIFIAISLVFVLGLPAQARRHKKSTKDLISNPAYKVLVKGTQSGNMLARAMAVDALARFKSPETLRYTTDALHDPQWPVRKEAIRTLYRLKDKEDALKALKEAILDPTLPWEKDFVDIMQAFSKKDALKFVNNLLKDPKAQIKAQALKSLLHGGKSWVRFVAKQVGRQQPDAINVLKDAGRQQAEVLIPLLYRTRHEKIANIVMDLSKKTGVKIPKKVLLRFGRLHDKALRGRVALILAQMGYPNATHIIKDFVNAKGPDLELFLKVFSMVPDRRLIPKIKKRFLNDKTPTQELIYTLMALAKVHDSDAGRFVATGINSTDLNVRLASVRTITLFQGALAVSTLKKLLFEGNLKVKMAAARAIGDLARKENVETLQRALNQAYDTKLKLTVIHALAKIKDVSIVDVLSYHVYDANPEIKQAVLLAIARILDPKAAKLLRAFVEDPAPQIRKAVLRNLITVTPKVALSNFERVVNGLTVSDILDLARHFGKAFAPFVKSAIKSDVPFIRNAAFGSLNVIQPKQRKALLKKLVSISDYADVRRQALIAMAEQSCKDACFLAQAMLNDNDNDCKIAGIRVAGTCCGKKAGGMLQTIMSRPVDIVTISAAATYVNIPRHTPKRIDSNLAKKWLHK